jgi:hypothetical protein
MKSPRTAFNAGNRDLQAFVEQTGLVLNGNVSFGGTTSNTDQDKNMNGWKATGTSPSSANMLFTVSHNLPYVPIGFIVVRVNANAVIYDGGTSWTAATNSAQGTIYLKCSAASVAFTIIII